MNNFDNYANENKIGHNLKWPRIPDWLYRILITGRSGSGKTNALLNLINNQSDIDKIYLSANDTYEAKYQILISKRERTGLKQKLLLSIQMICKMFTKILMITMRIKNANYWVFDDIIADIINNQKLNSIIIELFITGRKLNISLVFIT